MWNFIQEWMAIDGPAKLIRYHNFLYAHNADDMAPVLKPESFAWLQDEARKRLDRGIGSEANMEHWRRIVAGELPFGWGLDGS